MKQGIALIKDLLMPPVCVGCGRRRAPRAEQGEPFCAACARLWESAVRTTCTTCSRPYFDCTCLPRSLRDAGCVGLVKLAPYGKDARLRAVRRAVMDLKRHRRLSLLAFLGAEWRDGLRLALAEAKLEPQDCVITYLPRAARNLQRDGVDQARELALALSKAAGIPMEPLLTRVRRASVQKHLDAAARARNLKGVFAAEAPSAPNVILLDDVVTTGASMSAATAALIESGAKHVLGVCIAYTRKKKRA